MKKRIWSGALAIFLIIGMLPGQVSAESVSQIKARLDALETEKAEIDAHIAQLEGQLSDNRDEMEQIVEQKNLIDQEVFLLNQQITNLNSQITEYGLLIADKQEELDEKEEHLAQLQEQNQERIRAMEKNGQISYWSVIFKANSFVDLLDRLRMIEQIQQADKQRIEEMAQAAQAVSEAKEGLETEKTALEDSKKELEESEEELENKRAEADELLAQLVARGAEFEALMEESEAEQAELMQRIANTEDAYEDAKYQQWLASQPLETTTPASGSGEDTEETTAPSTSTNTPSNEGWIVPCSYVLFSSPFGYRVHPIDGVWRMHYGVDLANGTDTPIYASRSGTVSDASYNSSAGYYVQINHGDGYKSIYMHMTHYVVSTGQYVEQGQLIGYMGNTGASKGTHLHFGISYNGTYVNPADYIDI